MTIVLELPPDLENKLASSANQRGLSLPDYVLQLLNRDVVANLPAKSGADLLAYWQNEGVIGSRPDIIDSAEHARRIRLQAETRERG